MSPLQTLIHHHHHLFPSSPSLQSIPKLGETEIADSPHEDLKDETDLADLIFGLEQEFTTEEHAEYEYTWCLNQEEEHHRFETISFQYKQQQKWEAWHVNEHQRYENLIQQFCHESECHQQDQMLPGLATHQDLGFDEQQNYNQLKKPQDL